MLLQLAGNRSHTQSTSQLPHDLRSLFIQGKCSGIRCDALVHAISIACLRRLHIESTWFGGKSALHLSSYYSGFITGGGFGDEI